MSQSFNLLNRLGTNVSVLTDQPSAVETVLQPSVNEVAESEPAIANDPDRNQSVAEFFALFAEPFEAEETTAAEDAPPSSSAALPHTERAPESNNTMTEAETTALTDPVGGESESGTILETSLGSKSIAENLRELKEMQETQMKERLELAKKREENESVLSCLRERVSKYEKEQLELERKRKALMADAGVTSRKMARLEALQRTVEEVNKHKMILDIMMDIDDRQHYHHLFCSQVVRGEGRREEFECPVCTEEMIPPKRIFQVCKFYSSCGLLFVCLFVCLFV